MRLHDNHMHSNQTTCVPINLIEAHYMTPSAGAQAMALPTGAHVDISGASRYPIGMFRMEDNPRMAASTCPEIHCTKLTAL